ncbi:ribosomal protein S4 [Pneumocystis murina B123]|uniref:Ribosomal protein S4 n=1 Tax=Pneumocystis murina (strain B123) TaxID=1069680 RepID=M7PEJ7_PNEMU|nr:ribosomal protein S4 [Pneumocystis murina B123]EMR08889.1 ribosomal protein S4 [Pneumocystis murina B123]
MSGKILKSLLKSSKIRMSWSKQNLYKLSRKIMPIQGRTLSKQIISAKNETRAYHGEMLREHQWRRLFSLSEIEKRKTKELSAINLYSILERRIDTIIHRALFASSIKQARQMVIHGKVKINGKRVRDPGYFLEPGDMFSADVITVMRNTGSHEMFQNKSLKGNKSLKKIEPYIPRPYMSPFSFVPVYLEVSYLTCSGIYLRHPKSRLGVSEIPSPFSSDEKEI